jgi:hypothetical protein
VLQSLGLKLIRLGSKRPICVVRPPSWAVEHIEPQPTNGSYDRLAGIGVWMLKRANPLAAVDFTKRIVKVLLP